MDHFNKSNYTNTIYQIVGVSLFSKFDAPYTQCRSFCHGHCIPQYNINNTHNSSTAATYVKLV